MSFLNLALEDVIISYLSGSLDPMQLTASYVTGYGNIEDLNAPVIVVNVTDGNQTYHKSNVYELFANIYIKEMAADVNTGSLQGYLGILAHNVENMFWDPNIESNLNSTSSMCGIGFVTYQCQSENSRHSKNLDTLTSEMTLRVVGTLSGSLA